MSDDCNICFAMQAVTESDLVKDALEKKELSVEGMLNGIRDGMALGWALRDMKADGRIADAALCEAHKELVHTIQTDAPTEG
jgi:hypothetical protein